MKQLLILALIASIGLCAADGVNSFRFRSTSGALDDELEYAFDPLDLQYIQGTKFFSSLNNIDSYDQLLSGNGGNYLLLGAATDRIFLDNLRAALLFTYFDNKDPLDFEVYPTPDDEGPSYGSGEAEYLWQSYYDENDNGLYDSYRSQRQYFNNTLRDKGCSQYLVLNYRLSETSALGYKIGLQHNFWADTNVGSDLHNFDDGTPSLDILTTWESLEEMDPSAPYFREETEAHGDFGTQETYSDFLSELGYQQSFGAWEASGRWTFDYLKSKYFTDDWCHTSNRDYHEVEGAEPTVYEETEEETAAYEESLAGMVNRLSGRLRYFLIPSEDLRRAGYWSFGLGAGMKNQAAKYKDNYSYIQSQPGDYFQWEIEDIGMDGDLTGFMFNSYLRLNYPLNEHTILGAGLYFDHQRDEMKGDFDYLYTEIDSIFDTGSGAWDGTIVETSHSAGDVNRLESNSTFRVPVGLEYWFSSSRKWAMRVGTVFTNAAETSNDSYQYTLVEPTLVQQTDADDPEHPYTYNEDNTTLMESHSYKSIVSSTEYNYGLCYQANPNLKIEVMGMFDQSDLALWNTDFFRNLRLAFTVSF